MRGLIIDTEGSISSKEYGEPLYKTLGETVGGYIEIVRPKYLPEPFIMIANEEGLLQQLPLNVTGSILYAAHEHGHPVVGKIVIMREGYNSDGVRHIVGLEPDDDLRIFNAVNKITNATYESPTPR